MQIIQHYFPELTQVQLNQFSELIRKYQEWNQQINLVSRKDIDAIELRHILHSLAIAKFMQFKPGTKLLDVGTGGGLPGLPLAIMFPACNFLLVDSIGKKIKVVQNLIETLGLQNSVAENVRVEKVAQRFHFILSRAVAQTPKLLAWTQGKFERENFNKPANGHILLKGGDLTDELSDIAKCKEVPLTQYYKEDFFDTKKIIYIPMQPSRNKTVSKRV